MRKHFDKNLHKLFDQKAKNAAIKLFEPLGISLIENSETKGVDLLAYKDGEHLFYVETEVKSVWATDEFPYENVQFPYRKQKYAILDKPTIFLMFNGRMNKFLTVCNEDLVKSPVEIVRNKYVAYGEYFYQVPFNKVSFNDIQRSVMRLGV